jgi:hypothetical protein
MKRFFTVLVILLTLAVIAAHAGSNSFSGPDLLTQRGAQPVKGSAAHQALPEASFQKERGPSLVVGDSAADFLSTEMKEPDNEPDSQVDGTGEDEKNGEDEKKEKTDGDAEKDGGSGGWDRLWDAPRLG